MYTVHLDFVLHYVPPMVDSAHGIRLTRTIELPFPPAKNVSVFSKDWEGIEEPLGYHLKEVTWDIDRQWFLADTEMSTTGVPIAMIPLEVRALLHSGWKYGSYRELYVPIRRKGKRRKKLKPIRISKWDEDQLEAWETTREKSRPKEFLAAFHAVISLLAELRNNCGVGYAMMKIAGFSDFSKEFSRRGPTPFDQKFLAAIEEFHQLPDEQQSKWREGVQRRYPRFSDVVEAIR